MATRASVHGDAPLKAIKITENQSIHWPEIESYIRQVMDRIGHNSTRACLHVLKCAAETDAAKINNRGDEK
jgi:hypothetical protein